MSVNSIRQLINPAYDPMLNPAIACNRRGCFKESPKYAIELLTSSECDAIHDWSRQGWLDTAKKWAEDPDRHGEVVASMTEFLGAIATTIPPEPDYLEF